LRWRINQSSFPVRLGGSRSLLRGSRVDRTSGYSDRRNRMTKRERIVETGIEVLERLLVLLDSSSDQMGKVIVLTLFRDSIRMATDTSDERGTRFDSCNLVFLREQELSDMIAEI